MYAARVENGTATQVIVGTAEWAAERLGGTWADSDVKVGIGWTFDGTQFTPPAPLYPDDEGADEASTV